MQKEKQDIELHHKALFAIWAVLLILQLLLLPVVFFAKRELFDFDLSGPVGGKNPVFNFALLILAVLCFTIALIVRSILIRIATRDGVRALLYVTVMVGVTNLPGGNALGGAKRFSERLSIFLRLFCPRNSWDPASLSETRRPECGQR